MKQSMRHIPKLVVFVLLLELGVLAVGRVARATPFPEDDPNEMAGSNPLPTVSEEFASVDINPEGNCRFGVATLSPVETQVDWVDDFYAGWYLDFSIGAPSPANDAEFVPMIRVKQRQDPPGTYLPSYDTTPPLTDAGLGAQIDNRPGALWIVGNEVDRAVIQGDTFPDVYATAYHEVYHYIKQRDPSAQVSNSGLVQVTPGRLQYLDLMWEAYMEQFGVPMPVDVWNMHIYILPEKDANGNQTTAWIALGTDPALAIYQSGGNAALCPLGNVYCYAEHDDLSIFADQVVAMRQWMRKNGQQNKPLILSEYSLLYPYKFDDGSCFKDEFGACFDPQRVSDFLRDSVEYMETAADPALGYRPDKNRLVQQWLWFSVYIKDAPYPPEAGSASNLVKANLAEMTEVGLEYRDIAATRPLTVNLVLEKDNYTVGFTDVPTGTADVPLTVRAFNNGSRGVFDEFKVTFYADAALTIPIGTATIAGSTTARPAVPGCARLGQAATVTWSGLGPGLHQYWIRVDDEKSISESSEGDNVRTAFVLVNPKQVYLPAVLR